MVDNPLLNEDGDPFDITELSRDELVALKRRVQIFKQELIEERYNLHQTNMFLTGESGSDYIDRRLNENEEDTGQAFWALETIENLLQNQ